MKVLIAVLVAAFVLSSPTAAHAYNILWGYETWSDTTPADGQVDEWGRYNVSFVPNAPYPSGEQTATATILGGDVWGKTYYGTGASSTSIINTYRYFYIETYDIQGNMKLAVSGPFDADYYDFTSQVVSGDTGNPNVIYNPGPYVFDVSGWTPSSPVSDVFIHLIAEGGAGQGFEVNRLFFADDNPMNPIPEPTSLILLTSGLVGLGIVSRRKK